MANRASIMDIINLIDKLSDLTEEEAAGVLEEYSRISGASESMAAIFSLADFMRKEKAAAATTA